MLGLVQARLRQASDAFLQCARDPGALGVASAVCSRAVCALLEDNRATGLSAEDLEVLRSEVASLQWTGEDGVAILSLLPQNSSEEPTSKKPRRAMQDFRHFFSYFSEAQWGKLLDVNVSMNAKLDLIISVLVGHLGCRCPNEGTKKLIYIFWKQVAGLPDDTAVRALCGKRLKALDRKMPPPEFYLAVLPANPEVLEQAHPDLFKRVFPTDRPVKCKLDEIALLQSDASVKTRPGEQGTQISVIPTLNIGGGGGSGMTATLEAFGGMMLEGMKQMQNTQNRVLDLVLGGNASSRSLQDLQLGQTPGRQLQIPNVAAEAAAAEAAAAEAAAAAAAAAVAAAARAPHRATAALKMFPETPETRKVELGDGSNSSGDALEATVPLLQPVSLFGSPPEASSAGVVVKRFDAGERARRREKILQLAREQAEASKPPDAGISGEASVEQKAKVGETIRAMLLERKQEQDRKRNKQGQESAEAGVSIGDLNSAPAGSVKGRVSKGLVQTPAKVKKQGTRGKGKGKGKSKHTPASAKAACMQLVAVGGAVRFDKPKYCHERSRNQILCRTGLRGPGQSVALKYGPGMQYRNEAAAIAAAKIWVSKEQTNM